MAMPLWSNGIREMFTKMGLSMLNQWFNDFATWSTKMTTDGDITCSTAGTGLVVTNPEGTIQKRIRLNSAGTGIVIEDV